MSISRTARPLWFVIVATLLLLWAAMGCFACVQQWRLGADTMFPGDVAYHRLYAALPGWYNVCYAIGVATGLFGAIGLLARQSWARPMYIASLAAVVVQYGYTFAATDMIALKGPTTFVFPVLIAAIGAFAIWLSTLARRRGWIG